MRAYSILGFPPLLRDKLICNPVALETLTAQFEVSTHECAGLKADVVANPLCPADEAWLADGNGHITRFVWGERHSKAMAEAGPRDVDANGSPVEAA
jgi:hypothetical protein